MQMSFVTLMFCAATLLCFAQDAQPAPEGGGGGGGTSSNPAPESVLKSADALDVARFSCAGDAPDKAVACQAVLTHADAISKKFTNTLKLSSGGDSDFAKAVKALLSETKVDKEKSIPPPLPSALDVVILHIVDHRANTTVAAATRLAGLEDKLEMAKTNANDTDKNKADPAKKAIPELEASVSTARSAAAAKPVARERWIVAERKGKTDFTLSEGTRIYGKKNIGLIFLHVNALVPAGSDGLEAYSDVVYKAIVAPKLPENIRRLLGLLRIAATAQAGITKRALPTTTALAGWGVLRDVDVPSDVTFFCAHMDAQTLIGTAKKYDNEGLYFWDASVAVPVNKATLLDYKEQDGGFVPKQINKQSIFGAVNIYPWKVDIKKNTGLASTLPRAVVGIGLTGRPGDTFLVGGAWGFSQLQFFVGSGFYTQRVQSPGAAGGSAALSTERYRTRLTYGINVPVWSALQKLTEKKAK